VSRDQERDTEESIVVRPDAPAAAEGPPYILSDLHLTGKCPRCSGDITFRHFIASKVPGFRVKAVQLPDGRLACSIEGRRSVTGANVLDQDGKLRPGIIYHATRLSCVDCGFFEQRDAKNFEESDTWTRAVLKRIGRSDAI
jgi:hypothetical protein